MITLSLRAGIGTPSTEHQTPHTTLSLHARRATMSKFGRRTTDQRGHRRFWSALRNHVDQKNFVHTTTSQPDGHTETIITFEVVTPAISAVSSCSVDGTVLHMCYGACMVRCRRHPPSFIDVASLRRERSLPLLSFPSDQTYNTDLEPEVEHHR